VKQTYRVLWDNEAKASLKAIVAYIRQDSPEAAQKVKQALLRLAASLKQLPDRFSTEPYLEGRAGSQKTTQHMLDFTRAHTR
jgi:plasmid stabilization system protein ParE